MPHYKSSINLDNKKELIQILNQQLADNFDVYSQLKQAHWNVKGMQFYALHQLFDDLAAEMLGFVDMIAERVTALGGVAKGTVRMAAANSKISQSPDTFDNGEFTVNKMVEKFTMLAESTRKCIDDSEKLGDKATADLFTEVTRGLDKGLWILESHLL